MKIGIMQCMKQSKLCSKIKERDILRLLSSKYCNILKIKKGQRIFSESDVPEKIYILLSGSVLIAKDTISGKRMILARIDDIGDVFGEVLAFVKKGSYNMYSEADANSEILAIDSKIFEDKDQENGTYMRELYRGLMSIFASKAYNMNQRLQILGGSDIRTKIIRFLIQRQDHTNKIRSNMTREEFADYLNVTRPSLSREISKMVKEGMIRTDKKDFIILDQEELEKNL